MHLVESIYSRGSGGCVGAVKADPKAAFAKIDGGAPAKKDDAKPADKPATAK